MKRILAGLLMVCAVLLCACNQVPEQPTETQTTGKPTETGKPSAAEKPAQTEKPADPKENVELYGASYALGSIRSGTGESFDSTTRFAVSDYIHIVDIEAVSVAKGYQLSWFAYDYKHNYLGNGKNTYPDMPAGANWLTEGSGFSIDSIVNWNEDTEYIKVIVRKNGDARIDLTEDLVLSDIKIYASGYRDRVFSYEAEGADKTLSINNVGFIINDAAGLQDGAVYGDYLFAFNSNGGCKVYSSADYSYVAEFELDKSELSKPHSNSACFGRYKYDEGDEFPLLYVNIYNTYPNDRSFDGTCNVYRLVRNRKTFTSELVQVIKVGFTDDSEKWCSQGSDARPYGNFAVDAEKGKLYAFTMRDGDKTTRFFEFDLPALDAGTVDDTLGVNRVVLTADDVTDSFSTEYFNYIQGCAVIGGKIYSLEGFTHSAGNRPTLRIVDTEKKKVVATVDLYAMGFAIEPEAVFALDGAVYYFDRGGNIYELTFN